MMNGAHAATGLVTGAAVGTLAGMSVPAVAASSVIGAGAALWPDIDHDNSTITHAGGWGTRYLLAEPLQALARWTYRRTYAVHDPHPHGHVGEHRGLVHVPAFHLIIGLMVAAGTLLSPWVAVVVSALMLLAASSSLRWDLPRSLRAPLRLGAGLWPPVMAAAGTYALMTSGVLTEIGPWLGLVVTIGMVMHSIGDGWTNSGIPFGWPVRQSCQRCAEHGQHCPGARWRKRHTLPAFLRWSAGAARETGIKWICIAGSVALVGLPL